MPPSESHAGVLSESYELAVQHAQVDLSAVFAIAVSDEGDRPCHLQQDDAPGFSVISIIGKGGSFSSVPAHHEIRWVPAVLIRWHAAVPVENYEIPLPRSLLKVPIA